MLIRRAPMFRSSEITDDRLYLNRRSFMTGVAALGAAALAPAAEAAGKAPTGAPLKATRNPAFVNPDPPNKIEDATSYNNFYEFGVNKDDPARLAPSLKTRPWTVAIEGEVKKPQTIDVDSLMKLAPLEERIYRHRCVEGWSMVIPWIGFPLSALIDRAQPTSKAMYVEFVTLFDRQQMPHAGNVLDWPYREGLRMDEAMHPLTILVFGLYGEVLPNQNGAPVRIHVPWKYGFKSAKSIVKIRFVEQQPQTTWSSMAANEYGFYSNVNPQVDHPRWSQASERVIGGGLFAARKPTQMFNGYGKLVASMYNGMDLRKNY